MDKPRIKQVSGYHSTGTINRVCNIIQLYLAWFLHLNLCTWLTRYLHRFLPNAVAKNRLCMVAQMFLHLVDTSNN